MADVFISYKRDEKPAVERIAAILRDLGLSVWFDASMSAGDTFSDEIDREARSAKSILVCWSPAAKESRWVKAEAMIGFEQDKLAAAYVAGPDGFVLPTPFNTSHAEDLRRWLSDPQLTDSAWRSLVRRIGRLCQRADLESWGALDSHASAASLRAWLAQHNESPLFVTVDEQLKARLQQEQGRAQRETDTRRLYAEAEKERQHQEAAADLVEQRKRRRTNLIVASTISGIVAIATVAMSLLPTEVHSSATASVDRPIATVFARFASTPVGSTVGEGVTLTNIVSAENNAVVADVAFADGGTGRLEYLFEPEGEGTRVRVELAHNTGPNLGARFSALFAGSREASGVVERIASDFNAMPNAVFAGLPYRVVELSPGPFLYVENCSSAEPESVTSIISQAEMALPGIMRQLNLEIAGQLIAVEPHPEAGQFCYQVGYPFRGRAPRQMLIGQAGQTPSGSALRIDYTGTEADVVAQVYDRVDALLAAAHLDDPATRDDDWVTMEFYYDDPTQPGGSRNRSIYYIAPDGVDLSAVTRVHPPLAAAP